MTTLNTHTYANIREARLKAPESEIASLSVRADGQLVCNSSVKGAFRNVKVLFKGTDRATHINTELMKTSAAYSAKLAELQQKSAASHMLTETKPVYQSIMIVTGVQEPTQSAYELNKECLALATEVTEYAQDLQFIFKLVEANGCRASMDKDSMETVMNAAGNLEKMPKNIAVFQQQIEKFEAENNTKSEVQKLSAQFEKLYDKFMVEARKTAYGAPTTVVYGTPLEQGLSPNLLVDGYHLASTEKNHASTAQVLLGMLNEISKEIEASRADFDKYAPVHQQEKYGSFLEGRQANEQQS